MVRGPRFVPQLILALAAVPCFRPFGTVNEPDTIGQHCEHERITRAAFACHPAVNISDGRCFEEESLHQLAGRSGPPGHFGRGTNGAVGAPDLLDPVPEGPEAHCDNADYLDSEALGLKEAYPKTRQEATAQLQICVNHLRQRLSEGIDGANKIVDEEARIIAPEVDLSVLDCRYSFRNLQLHIFSRGKCAAIEGFGRALHGIQDFYAHSNWADEAEPPYGPDNPPGLKRDDYPIFLDLRSENNITDQVPRQLSTGCFGGLLTDGPVGKAGHPLEPGSLDCTGRITHHTLNKDNGIIDQVTGLATNPGPNTPRSNNPRNFQRAVFAAIKDSMRQWRHFREEIRRTYGAERGNIIICSLVRDNPATDCYGRKVAILRDAHSGSGRIAGMQIPIHKWLMEELEGKAHDEGPGEGQTEKNTTKSRGSSDKLWKPLPAGDMDIEDHSNPVPVVERGLDFSSSLADLTNSTSLPANKTSVVALTQSVAADLRDQLASIWHAGDAGVRVHVGLFPPAHLDSVGPLPAKTMIATEVAKEQDLITAVLRTGGTFSVLHNPEAVSSFLQHVVSRGLTHYDNAGDTATLLLPGLSISDYVTPEAEPKRYSFDARSMENVIISVAPISPRLALRVSVRHVRRNLVLEELDIGSRGNKTFKTALGMDDIPRTDAWFELEVQHIEGDGLQGSGLFEVSIETEDAGKSGQDNAQQANEGSHQHDEL